MATLSWRAAGGPLRGIALVVHGLNQRPQCMAPLIDLLAERGIGCLGLVLAGHGDNYIRNPGLSLAAARLASFQRVGPGLWQGAAAAAYALARTVSERAGVPLYLAAYSLGGLVVCDLMAHDDTVHFDRMVLLAPALAIRPWTRALRLLAGWPRWVFPSFAPPTCRANLRGTPIAAYNAVFALVAHFGAHAGARLDVPTLLLVDPADEMVSAPGLTGLIAAKCWRQWRIEPVYKTPPALGQYHHLLVGQQAVGDATWARMAGMIAGHFVTR